MHKYTICSTLFTKSVYSGEHVRTCDGRRIFYKGENMKKSMLVVAVACALVAAFSLCACSGGANGKLVKEGTLTVGTSPDYPPFENQEGDEIVGFEVDLVNAIGEKLGLKVEYVSMDFDGIIALVESGTKIDMGMSGFSITPERKKETSFSTSYYSDDLAVAVLKDGAYTDPESLKASGIKIAVQSGTTGETQMKEDYPNAQVVAYKSSNDIFAALSAGQVQACCTNISVVGDMLRNSYTNCVAVKKIASDEPYGLAIAKKNTKLMENVNKALDELIKDGTVDKLQEKWGLKL